MEPWDQAKTEDSKLTMTKSTVKPIMLLFFKFLVSYNSCNFSFFNYLIRFIGQNNFKIGLVILVGAVVSHSVSSLIFISLYANNTQEISTLEESRNITNSTSLANDPELPRPLNDNMKCLFLILFLPEVHRFLRHDFYLSV